LPKNNILQHFTKITDLLISGIACGRIKSLFFTKWTGSCIHVNCWEF